MEGKIFRDMKKEEITRYVKILVRFLHERGATTKKLAKVFNCPKSTVEKKVKE